MVCSGDKVKLFFDTSPFCCNLLAVELQVILKGFLSATRISRERRFNYPPKPCTERSMQGKTEPFRSI